MDPARDSNDLLLHASCVAWKDRAVLITGASGTGKSTLALRLLAYGCLLVSDDQTILQLRHDTLVPKAPKTIAGQIEARGIGILKAKCAADARVTLVVDLDQTESARLPPQRSVTYLGVGLPLIYHTDYANFLSSVLQMLKAGGRTA